MFLRPYLILFDLLCIELHLCILKWNPWATAVESHFVHEGNHSRILPSSPQEKLGHSRSMCFQINSWYYRPMLKYHEITLNSYISLQRC